MQRKDFIDVKRIVIKLGTNVLRNDEGEVALSRIYSFIEDISKLVKQDDFLFDFIKEEIEFKNIKEQLNKLETLLIVNSFLCCVLVNIFV